VLKCPKLRDQLPTKRRLRKLAIPGIAMLTRRNQSRKLSAHSRATPELSQIEHHERCSRFMKGARSFKPTGLYKGLWVVADGQVSNLVIPDVAGTTVVLRNGKDLINARFDKKWAPELSHVNEGDTIKIRGRISDSQNGQHLLECEVVH
jgi:hypothetical protein